MDDDLTPLVRGARGVRAQDHRHALGRQPHPAQRPQVVVVERGGLHPHAYPALGAARGSGRSPHDPGRRADRPGWRCRRRRHAWPAGAVPTWRGATWPGRRSRPAAPTPSRRCGGPKSTSVGALSPSRRSITTATPSASLVAVTSSAASIAPGQRRCPSPRRARPRASISTSLMLSPKATTSSTAPMPRSAAQRAPARTPSRRRPARPRGTAPPTSSGGRPARPIARHLEQNSSTRRGRVHDQLDRRLGQHLVEVGVLGATTGHRAPVVARVLHRRRSRAGRRRSLPAERTETTRASGNAARIRVANSRWASTSMSLLEQDLAGGQVDADRPVAADDRPLQRRPGDDRADRVRLAPRDREHVDARLPRRGERGAVAGADGAVVAAEQRSVDVGGDEADAHAVTPRPGGVRRRRGPG